MQSSVRLMIFAVFASCACFFGSPAAYGQPCVNQEPLCDSRWDPRVAKYVQNPDCVFVATGSFLASTTPSANPSDGLRVNPVGRQCGVTRGSPVPCGVRTTNNTCSESGPPGGCDPQLDPTCCDPRDPTCCDPFIDPTCGGGGGGGGCDPAWEACDLRAPGSGLKKASVDLEGTLRKVVLRSPLPKSVDTLLQELAQASAIYLKARVTIIGSADGTKQTGSYEYWERGGHYRLRLGPGLHYPLEDIAFDGKFLQGRTNQTMVQISRGDDRLTPFPDGPLTLALASLRVNDPAECPLCQLRLADLEKAVQWRQRESSAELASAERAIGTGTFDAGGQRTGESDAAGRLVHISWPADKENGQRQEITLSDYQPIAGTSAAFPMKLIERLANLSVQYTVEKIDLSSRFQDDVFDIYSRAPKLAFLAKDEKGIVHKRFLRYVPSPGGQSCGTKPPAGDKQ